MRRSGLTGSSVVARDLCSNFAQQVAQKAQRRQHRSEVPAPGVTEGKRADDPEGCRSWLWPQRGPVAKTEQRPGGAESS